MRITKPNNQILTDRLLSSWIRCKRKAWLDLYENKERKIWVAHRSLELDHQYRSLMAFAEQKLSHGIESCHKGHENVIGIRLKMNNAFETQLEGHPTLIHKREGKSYFGNFKYQPVIAKQGRRLTRKHRLLLTLWAFLLESFQKASVEEGLAISITNKGLNVLKVPITKTYKKQLIDSLKKLLEGLSQETAPNLTSDRKKCLLCPWKEVCDAKAKQEGNLSEINGIGAKRKEMLETIGINNLEELASADSKDVSEKLKVYGESHGIIPAQIINQAEVQRDLIPKQINSGSILAQIKNAPGVIIYDIESDPDINHDFLHGLTFIKRDKSNKWDAKKIEYKGIISLPENNLKSSWEELNKEFQCLNEWPILHYGETEYITICKLAKHLNISENESSLLKKRFFDIHKIIRIHWMLPVNSYGLKSVAKWLGFSWSQRNANGAQALLWWRQWRSHKEDSKAKQNALKNILQYNRDDCLATWEITKWLLKNKT
ncbi:MULTISPECIES: TM0106 family RecB-like putative nuclease [Prochlorococcus]|uniref:TM0106 family RecB-like putative nuclease n=1 Tax=Prochlorococcus TaxID=1218 RepID=UPI0005337555|nr:MULTISPECIES: TM0106 family RecB-like putative nuclease [Prochlorococcus]KGG13086.1 DNA repair enzyme [Prochlorococcus sp. MIT 0601]